MKWGGVPGFLTTANAEQKSSSKRAAYSRLCFVGKNLFVYDACAIVSGVIQCIVNAPNNRYAVYGLNTQQAHKG